MNIINNIRVVQSIVKSNTNQMQNEYHFYAESGFYFGGVCLPCDGQFWLDNKVITVITKILALRWKLIQPKRRQQQN